MYFLDIIKSCCIGFSNITSSFLIPEPRMNQFLGAKKRLPKKFNLDLLKKFKAMRS